MFKDVPYFCHSHLLSLLNVAGSLPAGTKTPPKFNPLALPPPPMHMEKILTPDDLKVALQMIQDVSTCCKGMSHQTVGHHMPGRKLSACACAGLAAATCRTRPIASLTLDGAATSGECADVSGRQ